MTIISTLNPALSLGLLNPNLIGTTTLYRKMLRVTFLHLLFRRVLVAVPVAIGKGRKAVKVTHTGQGPAFDSYPYKPYELRFRECQPAHFIPLAELTNTVRFKSFAQFNRAICTELIERGLLQGSQRKWLFFTGTVWTLTTGGDLVRKELESLLAEGEYLAVRGGQVDSAAIQGYLNRIGPNLVLLTAFSPHLVQEWRQAFQEDASSYHFSSGTGYDSATPDYNFSDGFFTSGGDDAFSEGLDAVFDSGGSSDSYGDSSSAGSDGGGDSGGD
ncbi:MAG: hypothetical protein JWP00_979 [Chloroflexi bacterium]|nr:hypothetical protein [Chloroflexota bacterium]